MPDQQEKDPILLTRQDTQPTGHAAAQRRKSKVRLDLNNATQYQGLTIPNG
ncbi:hypothetical protein I5U67_01610 [Stenotrophomonas maltophilia]|uniref:Uncharacterized protein n=1 Tax=Stenotrophomonas maltophilia TaxID=40324 RepID=A0AA89W6L2_STEMA|nr:hypothetical protein [Stenotrophomonas maltophilia]